MPPRPANSLCRTAAIGIRAANIAAPRTVACRGADSLHAYELCARLSRRRAMRLLHRIRGGLAGDRVLFAGAAAAADRADQLAAFNQRESARARHQSRIERGDVAVAALE